ncbi:outer membrane lipoprotein-sorting protein [Solemya pervernicosa gill symbiont]|uniref:Outer membrane lipoprotein-sorting protein n=2 Tax=Gammaproteobacteria incertae sedis TaxID=118884 RepID=A0A1T2L4R5_9GAMM|nr:outer membrane lipoprotein-sorting protein [Candidatus Reidiella endopervernicosa]OOZ40064.1 outer membrane lipoprotein-sorting protein [Solemya pervernicosa gill symbiont]QKQ27648.1 outer membrane lipoprotein-sorting protein [Candidatus Reidiella endopervernicosa]
MNRLTKLTTAAFALLLSASALAEISAREIMQKVDDRDDGDNRVADMTMTLIDKGGSKRIRSIRSYDKDKGEDKQRIMFFLTPADVQDTAFLTYDYDAYEKDDDQWLYLPALRKTKRIASSDKSGSFMGSDFNYSDMTRKNLDANDFRIVKEAEVRGSKVWMIEAKPKTQEEIEETGYKKSLLFVRQDNFIVVRAVHWTNEGKRLKYQDVSGLEKIDNVWTITKMTMTTKKGKATLHKTELGFSNIRYNQDLEEQFFSIRQLEKGLM